MTPKKFTVVLILALAAILLLLGVSLVCRSGRRTNFGRVALTHKMATYNQLAMTTCVRNDWPFHPKHRMQFIQIYNPDGSVLVEDFSVVDDGVEGGVFLIRIESSRGEIGRHSLENKAKAKGILDEERYKFGLPNYGN